MSAIITSPMIGASLTQVWKAVPAGATGAAASATAPFAIGTMAEALVDSVPKMAQFARVGATGIAAGATTVGITSGVTAVGATGNFWVNNTGVALVEGDHAFFTSGIDNTP